MTHFFRPFADTENNCHGFFANEVRIHFLPWFTGYKEAELEEAETDHFKSLPAITSQEHSCASVSPSVK